MRSKFPYRVWQYWKSFRKKLEPGFLEDVDGLLNPEQLELFFQLPVSDQNHSYRVYKCLIENGENNSQLLRAALLHDLGKVKFPLKSWERAAAVLIIGAFPELANRWAAGEPKGIRKSLVVYHNHPEWGAVLAQKAGCSPLTVWLIENHESLSPGDLPAEEAGELLMKLQNADNQN
jgi:hypothetical protein